MNTTLSALAVVLCLFALCGCAGSQIESARSLGDIDLRQILLDEVGVNVHAAEAVPLLAKAARAGDSAAQVKLGRYTYLGMGVAANHAQAATLFEQAAERGDHQGRYLLAVMLSLGDGLDRDFVSAYRLLTRVMSVGDRQSRDAAHLRGLIQAQMTPGELELAGAG